MLDIFGHTKIVLALTTFLSSGFFLVASSFWSLLLIPDLTDLRKEISFFLEVEV